MINSIYLVSQLFTCGPINQAYNITTAIRDYGVNPIVVTLFDERKETWIDKFQQARLEVLQLHCHRNNLWLANKRLQDACEQYNIQIVHSSGFSADLVNSGLSNKCRNITTMRGHIGDLAEEKNAVIRYIVNKVWRRAVMRIDARVCCSRSLYMDTKDLIGTHSLFYIQNGVDTDVFSPTTFENKMRLRKEMNIPLDKRVYLSVGKLEPRKNMQRLIRAFTSINDSNSVLLIVGTGQEEMSLRILSNDSSNIQLIGHTNNPLQYYQCADIYISASLAEGLPNSVLEALSCGLPCLLSEINSHEEIVSLDPEVGSLFNPLSENDISQKIRQTGKWNLSEMGLAARRLIESNLSKYHTARKYAEMYKHIVNKNNT